ncbi:type IV pilus assembly protein PilW [Duganella sp. 3397]|uniref:PilW family protein n=1 Tax=Duganella sp. 3397 TaxID=2817732 RepID=UPI0028676DE4|nr:PilW family protein [Duganella sp. 3397]MDR7048504.1 type IV pilus assembly protein PilW [Duganella sp. 3397]
MRRHGFSIVELMVSIVIGLLAITFATRLVVGGEKAKDAAVGGSDAMQNGMLALYSLSNDAGDAGWGLNDPMLAGCNTEFSDSRGFRMAVAQRGGLDITPLAPVVIESRGAAPDLVTFYSGTSQTGIGSVKLAANYTPGESSIAVDSNSPYDFNVGDVLVVAPLAAAGARCTVMQMSGTGSGQSSANRLTIATGDQFRFNPQAGLGVPYELNLAYLYNLGSADRLHFHTWSVSAGVLLLRATDMPGSEANGASVSDNIVSLKAQYGFDNRTVPNYNPNTPGNSSWGETTASGMRIGAWSATMIDADGDGLVGGAGDYQRVGAVRLAVVARSKSTERPAANGACTATTVLPTVFEQAAPASVAAVPMQVNVAVAGDPVDWKCYRYRVFETIVPIRNAQWRP